MKPGILFIALVLSSGIVIAAPQSAQTPDNSQTNQRDRSPSELTADQQSQNRSDLELAQKVRKELVADRTLSTYAHNIKIIVRNGAVTLKGPVRSVEEKGSVEAKAAQVAGENHVTSELEVAPNK